TPTSTPPSRAAPVSCSHRSCVCLPPRLVFTHPATAELYTLSLHDALPIYQARSDTPGVRSSRSPVSVSSDQSRSRSRSCPSLLRSEEHTSELQSRENLVCRLLLEKKKITPRETTHAPTRPARRRCMQSPSA